MSGVYLYSPSRPLVACYRVTFTFTQLKRLYFSSEEIKKKGEGKFHSRTGHEGPDGE
jgi:hypothetical protein